MQLNEIYKIFLNKLKPIYSENEIYSIFALLVEYFIGYSKKDLLLKKQEIINEDCASKFFSSLKELEYHKPVQYIIGETEFYGLRIKVNKNVLIPRPETEELVGWIIKDNKNEKTGKNKILDIGTGSGCIAIALKKNLPEADLYAMDVSENALMLANESALNNKVLINFFQADIIKTQYSIPDVQYSIIVSNPPYVTLSEKEKMQKNVLEYEPHLALFVSEENPLFYYEAIVKFATKQLGRKGYIYFEINENYGEQIRNLLAANEFSGIILKQDLSGKNRMIRGTKE